MMNMQVRVDVSSLEISSLESITGRICIEIEEYYFPDPNWNDFPVVVLKWWLDSLKKLFRAGSAELHFMDGPYLVRLRGTDELGLQMLVAVHGLDTIPPHRTEPIEPFHTSVKEAAAVIVRACEARGWHTHDTRALRSAIELEP